MRSRPTERSSSCRTSRRSRESSMRRSRCPTSTRATAFPSAGSPRWSCPTASSRPAASATDINCGVRLLVPAGVGGRARRTPRAARARALARDPGRDREARPASPHDRRARRGAARGAARSARARDRTRGRSRPHGVERLPAGRRSQPRSRSGRTCAVRASSARPAPATTSSSCSVSTGSTTRHGAAAFGLAEGQLTVLIHSGSRGLGHQVCTDSVRIMDGVQARYGFELPDRQLACAPASSPEGRAYLGGHGRRRELRLREPAGARPRGARCGRARPRPRGCAGDTAGLRRRPQRGEGRAPRRAQRSRPPQGRHARVPRRLARDPRRLPARRPAGVHPRQHGHVELRARRRARIARALVRHDVPRRRPGDVADARAQARSAARSSAGSSRRRESSCAARRTRGSRRRRRSRTRTSTTWSRSSSAPASRAASRDLRRSAS